MATRQLKNVEHEAGLDLTKIVPAKADNIFMVTINGDGEKEKGERLIARTAGKIIVKGPGEAEGDFQGRLDYSRLRMGALYENFGFSALKSCADAALEYLRYPKVSLSILSEFASSAFKGMPPGAVEKRANEARNSAKFILEAALPHGELAEDVAGDLSKICVKYGINAMHACADAALAYKASPETARELLSQFGFFKASAADLEHNSQRLGGAEYSAPMERMDYETRWSFIGIMLKADDEAAKGILRLAGKHQVEGDFEGIVHGLKSMAADMPAAALFAYVDMLEKYSAVSPDFAVVMAGAFGEFASYSQDNKLDLGKCAAAFSSERMMGVASDVLNGGGEWALRYLVKIYACTGEESALAVAGILKGGVGAKGEKLERGAVSDMFSSLWRISAHGKAPLDECLEAMSKASGRKSALAILSAMDQATGKEDCSAGGLAEYARTIRENLGKIDGLLGKEFSGKEKTLSAAESGKALSQLLNICQGGQDTFGKCFGALSMLTSKGAMQNISASFDKTVSCGAGWEAALREYAAAISNLKSEGTMLEGRWAETPGSRESGFAEKIQHFDRIREAYGPEALLECSKTVSFYSGNPGANSGFLSTVPYVGKNVAGCAKAMRNDEVAALLKESDYLGELLTKIAAGNGQGALLECVRTINFYDREYLFTESMEKIWNSGINMGAAAAAMRSEAAKNALAPALKNEFNNSEGTEYDKAGLTREVREGVVGSFFRIAENGSAALEKCGAALGAFNGNLHDWASAAGGLASVASMGGDAAKAASALGREDVKSAIAGMKSTDPYYLAVLINTSRESADAYAKALGLFEERKDVQGRLAFQLATISLHGGEALLACCNALPGYSGAPEKALGVAIASAENMSGGKTIRASAAEKAVSDAIAATEARKGFGSLGRGGIDLNVAKFKIYDDAESAIEKLGIKKEYIEEYSKDSGPYRTAAEKLLTQDFLGPDLYGAMRNTKTIVLNYTEGVWGTGVVGCYIPGTNIVQVAQKVAWRSAITETDQAEILTHELLHFASGMNRANGNVVSANGVSYPYNVRENEGLTELFAQQLCRSHGISTPGVSYEPEVKTMFFVKQIVGERPLLEAYFTNDFSEVAKKLDAVLGKGSFEALMGTNGAAEMLALVLQKAEDKGVKLREWSMDDFWK